MRFSIRMTNRFKGVDRASVKDHQEILDFILAGDHVAAENQMRSLLTEAKSLLNEALEQEKSKVKNA